MSALTYTITINGSQVVITSNVGAGQDFNQVGTPPPVIHEMVEGKDMIISRPCDGIFKSDALLKNFDSIKIDGEIVDTSNYTVTEGSTIITLTEDYVLSLEFGRHNIEIISSTGSASCNFVVKQELPGLYETGTLNLTPWETIVENGLITIESGKLTAIDASLTGDLVVSDEVTLFKDNAFGACKNLTKVFIPKTLERVGWKPFTGASSITDIIVHEENEAYKSVDGVLYTKNGKSLIWYPTGKTQTEFTIPNGVTEISDYGFANCKALTSITIPPETTGYAAYAFHNCTGLKAVYISDLKAWATSFFGIDFSNPLYYGKNLYVNGELLTELIIPDDVKSIGRSAFFNCHNITRIVVPEGVTTIGRAAFWGCSKLETIELPSTLKSLGASVFYYCYKLKTITIPEGSTAIAEWMFNQCKEMTTVSIPSTVTQIAANAFSGCVKLEYIVLPDNLKTILQQAFSNCKAMTYVVIPAGIEQIGPRAFAGCASLTDVYFKGTEDEWNAITINEGNEYLLNATIHFNYTGE
jgi:hypothetical protein